MSKGVIPILAIATVSIEYEISIGSVAYFVNKFFSCTSNTIDRTQLIQIITALRKSIFSTLREIAYAANCLKII